ncbi:MAG: DNA primase [Bryobacteraceae bacterium]|nr:DNA primase [Bryobacteraceae bacterium]MDW8378412.1 DNA primase [Bryobacterales bacterium]
MDLSSFKEQVRSASNIVEIIGERVPLKRVGSRYVGRCPFHSEKTPSFSVNPNMQIYKCFGCGASGDVFKFIQEYDHVTFIEALKWVAERYGIPFPRRLEATDPDTSLRQALYRVNEAALRHFRSQLRSSQGAAARAYLQQRGVTMDLAEEFGLGFASASPQSLALALQGEGFSLELLSQAGLVLQRAQGGLLDRFRGRLIFPIHSESGQLAGFAGRALSAGDEPKYLNSPETAVYRKSNLLYNLNRSKDAIRQSDRVILVEGYMDVIGLWSAGIRETVASCGTALTAQQVKIMRRWCQTVVVNFDPDTAGQNAAERTLQTLLDEGMRVRVLVLDRDLDPDEYVRTVGSESYLRLVKQAPNYYIWLADRAKQRFDSRTAEGRQQALQFLLPALHRIPDKIERAGVAGDLASYLGVEPGLILENFKKAALDRRRITISPPAPAALLPAERILLRNLIHYPAIRSWALPRLRSLALLPKLRSSNLLLAMLSLWEHDPDFDYAQLEAQLTPTDATLLSEVIFADELAEDFEQAQENTAASLATLEAESRSASLDLLRQQIREAQQKGDMQQALALLEQLDRLQKAARTPGQVRPASLGPKPT